MGCPAQPTVAWDRANYQRLKDLGFNTLQLNIAWGYRPGGEALNLEDIVDVPDRLRGNAAMAGDQTPERRARRIDELHQRAALGKDFGFRTIFHFGAPYVGDTNIGDAPPNCLLDGLTQERCVYLLERFGHDFPEVDDILVYTYDQHAWLCNEFGPCPRCTGIPLVERVVPFIEVLAATWRKTHPNGRLWWEPWELSAGQVQRCVRSIKPDGIGLALHCNTAEVMTTIPSDRWLRNTSCLANERGIPVIVEYFLGGPSEEVEPYLHLAHPLATFRGLDEIARLPHVQGIKEYYGLIPDKEDPNLRMTGLFLNHPGITEDEALQLLAEPYGVAAQDMKAFWTLTSRSMELFPWDTSWLIREIGKSDPAHAMTAAFIRGVPWHTPNWMATRRAIFMKVDMHEEPDPWMLEDVQLRCELAAERMEEALTLGDKLGDQIPETLRKDFHQNLADLRGMCSRTRAYAYHIRETNIAHAMRVRRELNLPDSEMLREELVKVLEADRNSQGKDGHVTRAIELLTTNEAEFLERYFRVVPDMASKGHFSLTSR